MANKSYIGASGGTWNTTTNWSGSVLPVAGDDVFVTGNVTANSFINVNAVIPTINSLTIGDSVSPYFQRVLAGTAIGTAGTNIWTLNPTSTTITVTTGAYSTKGSSAADAYIRIPVSGSGKIIKSGPGSLGFDTAAASTWTGGIDIQTGSIAINNANNKLGTGPITFYDDTGIYNVNGSATYILGNSIIVSGSLINLNNTIAGNGILSLTGSFNIGSGGDKSIFTVSTVTISGIISGSSGLVKAGPGILNLAAINTYTGGTTVASGTLNVSADSGLGSNTTASLILSGGALVNTGSAFSTDRNVTLSSGVSSSIDGAITINKSIGGGGHLSHTTGELILNLSNSIGDITINGSSTITAKHSNSLGGSGTLTFANGGLSRLNVHQDTTLTKTYNFNQGFGSVGAYIGVYSGSILTLTSGSGPANIGYWTLQKQGIVQTSTTTQAGGSWIVIPDVGTAKGTTIFRDKTPDASGMPSGVFAIGNAILELSASNLNRTYGNGAGDLRSARSGDTDFDISIATAGQGFSSINPNGTTVSTSIAFQSLSGSNVGLWAGPMLFGTAYGTSTGKLTLSGPINLNGIDQEFYVFNGVTASGSIAEISSVITGSTLAGALSKTGPGTLRLTNKNTYIGLTAVGEGVLESTYIGLQYGSGSSTVGASILVGASTTYRYIGSGSQTYATLDLSNGSNTFKFDGAAGAYFPTMSLGANTVLTGTANQNAICEIDVITGDYPLALSGSNSWKISGLHASRTAATTALSGSKLILSTDHVGSGFVLGTGVTTIRAGATLETATGEIQSGKAKYNGSLVLGTAGSGAVKAKYKIGNGAFKDSGATIVSGNLEFAAVTNLQLNNATIFNAPGEYVVFKYTGTCIGFENLNPSTSVAGRLVSHMRHDPILKRIYVTLS